MIFTGKVLLVVIGSPGNLRSSALQTLSSKTTRCIFVEPVLILAGDRVTRRVDEQQSKLMYGRRLSDFEVGCSIAHRNATSEAHQELSRDRTLEWALIVEDDANLDSTTFKRIEAELLSAAQFLPTLVSFNSAKVIEGGEPRTSVDYTNALIRQRHLDGIAVCYAVNRGGLADIHNFSTMPISFVADWPLYYLRLEYFTSVHTRVSEVEGGSTIGHRPRLRIGERLLLHIRQLIHIRKIASNYGVPAVNVLYQLIMFPAWRDANARIELIARYFRLTLLWSFRKM